MYPTGFPTAAAAASSTPQQSLSSPTQTARLSLFPPCAAAAALSLRPIAALRTTSLQVNTQQVDLFVDEELTKLQQNGKMEEASLIERGLEYIQHLATGTNKNTLLFQADIDAHLEALIAVRKHLLKSNVNLYLYQHPESFASFALDITKPFAVILEELLQISENNTKRCFCRDHSYEMFLQEHAKYQEEEFNAFLHAAEPAQKRLLDIVKQFKTKEDLAGSILDSIRKLPRFSMQQAQAELRRRQQQDKQAKQKAAADAAAACAQELLEEEEREKPHRNRQHHKKPPPQPSGLKQERRHLSPPKRADSPITYPKVTPSPGPFQLVSPAKKVKQLHPHAPIYQLPADCRVVVHQRIERWGTQEIEKIQRFTDKNEAGAEIHRYQTMTPPQLLEQKLRHFVPGFDHLLQRSHFRERYMCATPQGGLLKVSIESPTFTESETLVSVGLNAEGLFYHLFIHRHSELPKEATPFIVDHLFRNAPQAPQEAAAAAAASKTTHHTRFEARTYSSCPFPTLHLFYTCHACEVQLTIYPLT